MKKTFVWLWWIISIISLFVYSDWLIGWADLVFGTGISIEYIKKEAGKYRGSHEDNVFFLVVTAFLAIIVLIRTIQLTMWKFL